MALVSLPSPIAWPGIVGNVAGSVALATVATLDASGEYIAYVFVARENMAITHVGFRAGTVAGAPTATVTIETLDATTGLPNGAGFGSSSGTTATISSSTYVLTALGATATITKGQMFCAKVAYASGTSIIVQHTNQIAPAGSATLPYVVTNVGTPTKSSLTTFTATLALGSSSTTFYQVPGTLPLNSIGGGAFNNTSAAKRGLRFTIPMNCRAIGARWNRGNAWGDYNIAIYDDTTGTAVELSSSSTAYDADNESQTNNSTSSVYFDNAVTLTAGTTYRLAVEPSSATNCWLATITLPSASYRGASPAGTTAHYTTFVTGGWTDTATDQIPLMDLLIDQVDNGAGSGGGVVGVIGG